MKRVICLLGYPGAGKSTAARLIQRLFGASVLHVPSIVNGMVPARVRTAARRWGKLIPGAEHPYLSAVARDQNIIVVLDGFPRSVTQFRALRDHAHRFGWRVDFVNFGCSPLRSFWYQLRRDARRTMTSLQRIPFKLARDLRHTPPVLRAASAEGFPVHTIPSHLPPSVLEQRVRQILGYDLQALGWDRAMLRRLRCLAPDAWVTGGGHVYRPFFNGVYGPPSESWDVDIRVWGEERANQLQSLLQSRYGDMRWHVKGAERWAREETGRTISSVEEAFSCMALICLCAGVRWGDSEVEVAWGHSEAEADLWRGVLRPNPSGQVNFAEAKARKIASYYPGVCAPFIDHERMLVHDNWHAIQVAVRLVERGGRKESGPLSASERVLADRVLELMRALDRSSQAVPLPGPSPPPHGDPWKAADQSFRAWVANQTRSRRPVGGRDTYLHHALSCQRGVPQKPSHQGWALDLHVLHALFVVETDHVPDYRRALRLAVLWHDVGKRENVQTPGAHPMRGAKLWRQTQLHRLPGLTEQEDALVSCLIANHDVLGRLARGLWDEGYRGALSPAAIRRRLATGPLPLRQMAALAKEIWRADVGSIPACRWLLPLANELEQLILAEEI